MTDTFFTRSGSSPGTRNLSSLEILADSILCNAGCVLVGVLHQSPILVLFRADKPAETNDPDLHLMRMVDLCHRNILRKLEGR